MERHDTTQPGTSASDEDADTEGQAFKWQVVDDPRTGKRLKAGWTPDDQPGRPARTNNPSNGKGTSSR